VVAALGGTGVDAMGTWMVVALGGAGVDAIGIWLVVVWPKVIPKKRKNIISCQVIVLPLVGASHEVSINWLTCVSLSDVQKVPAVFHYRAVQKRRGERWQHLSIPRPRETYQGNKLVGP